MKKDKNLAGYLSFLFCGLGLIYCGSMLGWVGGLSMIISFVIGMESGTTIGQLIAITLWVISIPSAIKLADIINKK